jgi:hypothetical protein
MRRSLLRFAPGIAMMCAASCSSSPRPISRVEDKARLDVPIAICRRALAPSELGDAGAPPVEAYWQVLMPSFRALGTPLAPSDADCTGGVYAARAGALTPVPVAADDTMIVPIDDGAQLVWLRVYRESNGAAVGPLAFMRARASELDVYALGTYRGSPKHSRFVAGRVGPLRAFAAYDDGCADGKVDAECESTLHLYGVVGGKIDELADTPAQRLRYGTLKGLGRVQYRLTTDPPVFDKLVVRVHERLQVRDSNDEDVRKAEGDRVFTLGDDGRLVAGQDSLWAQVAKP